MANMKQEDRFGHIPEIPESIRGIFTELCEDVLLVDASWRFYLDLFTSDENKALFNEVAPSSFIFIKQALRTEMIMGLCRLSDPASTLKKDNCSMLKLTEQTSSIDGLRSRVKELVIMHQTQGGV